MEMMARAWAQAWAGVQAWALKHTSTQAIQHTRGGSRVLGRAVASAGSVVRDRLPVAGLAGVHVPPVHEARAELVLVVAEEVALALERRGEDAHVLVSSRDDACGGGTGWVGEAAVERHHAARCGVVRGGAVRGGSASRGRIPPRIWPPWQCTLMDVRIDD